MMKINKYNKINFISKDIKLKLIFRFLNFLKYKMELSNYSFTKCGGIFFGNLISILYQFKNLLFFFIFFLYIHQKFRLERINNEKMLKQISELELLVKTNEEQYQTDSAKITKKIKRIEEYLTFLSS